MNENEQAIQLKKLLHIIFGKDESISYVIGRRDFKGKQPVKVCMYSNDQEALIIAAQKSLQPFTSYLISSSSKAIWGSSPYYLGSVSIIDRYHQTTGLSVSANSDLTINTSIRLKYFHDQKIIHCHLPPTDGVYFSLDNPNIAPDEKHIILKSTDLCIDHSRIKLRFEYEDRLSFLFEQTHNDEFTLQISYPFSIFQAFVVVLFILNVCEEF